MNGNRSKYTYTPTYGMQKRGLGKRSAPVHRAPEAPDFTQVPDPAIGVPLQQVMPQQNVQSSYSPALQMEPYAVQPSYLAGIPNQSASPAPLTAAQLPLATPSFVQQQMPPIQQNYRQPLGNSLQANMPGNASVRSQGFVPPQPNAAVLAQSPLGMPPQIGWSNSQTPHQSIPPFSGVSMGPGAQPAFQSVPQQPIYPPLQPVAQQPGFTVQPTAPVKPPRAASLDADKLWSVFLFGLLPLLFIPCLFVTNTWDALRYVFLGSAVLGLGVMWFRQMFTPVSRLIVSIVHVALCIVTIAMLMQGANEARQASASLGQPHQADATPTPTIAVNAVVPEATPAPEATVTGPSEAERRLELFMELWKVNNTTEMVNLVQPSWRGQQENASKALFLSLANRTPEDFTIEDISGTETDNSRTVTMRATINKNTGKPAVVYRFMVMMVKEGGEWYVNPNSLATNDAQETEVKDENVVNTQSSGSVTEPPRETVTPAPPASTLLYYNAGGNNYHMDPNCSKVASEYLPFDFSFPYSELKSYNKTLLPCLNCNAPVDPLD